MLVSGELTPVLDLALLLPPWVMKGGTPELREGGGAWVRL